MVSKSASDKLLSESVLSVVCVVAGVVCGATRYDVPCGERSIATSSRELSEKLKKSVSESSSMLRKSTSLEAICVLLPSVPFTSDWAGLTSPNGVAKL